MLNSPERPLDLCAAKAMLRPITWNVARVLELDSLLLIAEAVSALSIPERSKANTASMGYGSDWLEDHRSPASAKAAMKQRARTRP